jgi:transcriptional regulator with PAS, ATPase and Fis domain
MQRMLALARRVAESEASSVLLQGESGTGKDLVAKAIHFASQRADAPFVAINCAAIPSTLLESELFGYEKGAFTDAKGRKEGLFEQAEGGTIFLDEIGELELGLQAKLLRVLEEGAFRRVGGLKDLPLNVRVIAASNRDLRTESESGHFRLDLYYRLSVIQIDLPPLRERGDDVLLLANFYFKQFAQKLRKNIRGLTPEVAEIFRHYAWPGNVRELRNVLERALILETAGEIQPASLPDFQLEARLHKAEIPKATGDTSLDELLGGFERDLINATLDQNHHNLTKAAERLKISRHALRYRMQRLNIASPAEGSEDAVLPAGKDGRNL